MQVSTITAALQQAILANDRATAMQCLASYVHDPTITYASVADGHGAMDAVTALLSTFRDAGTAGGAFCAMVHIFPHGEARLPITAILHALKPHNSIPLVVQSAARLLHCHVASRHIQEGLPHVAEATAEWLKRFPNDDDIAHYASHILVAMNGIEPIDVKKQHGEHGVHMLTVSTIQGAAASRGGNLRITGKSWNDFFLSDIYPRMRKR